MCDTMVALGRFTKSGCNLFAKNSDRDPNEPQYYVHIPAADHAPGSKVKCTYIEIDQAAHTNALILSKPSWIWGGEMGINEYGVVIGNEAIWTKMPYGGDALLGMDMLRIGLERGKTAEEAVNVIIEMLETYGQGGNCAFDGTFLYHNTFLVTDPTCAYILETSGPYWALEKVEDIRSISNVMSVTKYERIRPGTIEHAIEQGWCESEKDFCFSSTYLDQSVEFGGVLRSSCTARTMRSDEGDITVETMMAALRNHNSYQPWEPFACNMPCMHAGTGSTCQSTASLIAEIRPDGRSTYWGTGMSLPCIAPFKPFWFDAYADELVFPYDKQEEAMDSWLYREQINRAMVAGKLDEAAYRKELKALEADWMTRCAAVEGKDAATRKAFCEEVAKEEKAFIDKWVEIARTAEEHPRGDMEYQKAWAYWNDRMGKNRHIAY